MLSFRYPSPKFLECRSISVSNFNSTCPTKSIFSPSRAIYIGYGCGSKNILLHLKPFVFLVRFLLSHRFEIMENNKRSAEEALNGSVSSCQCLHRQEGATRDAPIIPEQRADSAQPLGSSSAPIRRQLPRYPRRRIDNDDLLASIDRTDQNLANYLSLAESALAMIQGRSPPEASLVGERLARDEARIIGETSTTISPSSS